MFSGVTTGESRSPHNTAASPGSYLTVTGAAPHLGTPSAHDTQHDPASAVPLASLQPYYQLSDGVDSGAYSGATTGLAAQDTSDPLWSLGRRPIGLSAGRHRTETAPAQPGTSSSGNNKDNNDTSSHPRPPPPVFQAPLPASATPLSGSSPTGKTRLVSPAAIHILGASSPNHPAASDPPSRPQIMPRPTPSVASTIDYADIEQKQAELRGAVEYRIAHLESSLSAREEEVVSLRGQLRRLEEDYQFNYNLIGERDAALEEASAQLQRLYRELKRVSAEATLMEKKLRAAETDASDLRQASLEAAVERDKRVRQVESDFMEREKRLLAKLEEREAAMKADREAVHDRYMQLTRDVEKSRESVLDQHSVLSEDAASRQQQQQQRVEAELNAVRGDHKHLQDEKRALEAELAACKSRVLALEGEKVLLAQQVQAVEQDAEASRVLLERRLTDVSEDRGRTSTVAEEALREQARRLSALELEKAQLHRQVTDLEASLQRDTTAHEDAQRHYTSQVDALRRSYAETQRAMANAAEEHRVARQALEADLQSRTQALDRSEARLRESQESLQRHVSQLAQARETAARQSQEVARLTEDVQHWKDEESRTAAKARAETADYETRLLEAERALRDTKDALDRHTRRSHELQERQQSEAARLTRELHASEAARRALEDQYHLSQDQNAQATVLQGLRLEKEALQARVMELERTNGEIQTQITNFTLELQNDPLLQSARETQQRLVTTQQELLASKAEVQRLQGIIQAKEEEATRYQMAIMRQAFVLDDDHDDVAVDAGEAARLAVSAGYPTSRSSPSSMRVLRRQQQAQQEAFDALRDTCASLRKALKKEKRRRRRYQRRAQAGEGMDSGAEEDASDDDGSTSDDNEDNEGSVEAANIHGTHARRRGRREHGQRSRSPRANSRSRAHALPVDAETTTHDHAKEAQLLQESEVWRRKCLQLEQHLRLLLKERDQLQLNLRRAESACQAAQDEKRTLIDINAHLKSQLRDAYRTAYEAQGSIPRAPQAPLATTTVAAAAGGTGGGGDVSPEVYAAVLALLEREQQYKKQQEQQQQRATSAVDAVAASFDPSGHTPVRSATATRGLPSTGLNHSPEQSPKTIPTPISGGGGDRLSVLEEEIRHVKAQINATQQQQQQQGQRRRERADESAPVVVRRGGAAVRHYGFS